VTGGNAETLRRYWAEGEGAAKIRWGDPGDFSRCVEHVSKFMPGQAQGYCNLLHKRALGYYPATHAKMGAAMLHPRTPAGQAGGGKFAAKGGGGAGGKGKGAGKGGKGGAKSASAQAAAQAKVIAPQFMAMNPQQRAQFLAKLTDPQLKALLHEVAQGNSNDPATRAALIAIKDQVAARSLTGAKGPTAVNQAKTASAAKTAATKQASEDGPHARPRRVGGHLGRRTSRDDQRRATPRVREEEDRAPRWIVPDPRQAAPA
jgi:hypothetical protein